MGKKTNLSERKILLPDFVYGVKSQTGKIRNNSKTRSSVALGYFLRFKIIHRKYNNFLAFSKKIRRHMHFNLFETDTFLLRVKKPKEISVENTSMRDSVRRNPRGIFVEKMFEHKKSVLMAALASACQAADARNKK